MFDYLKPQRFMSRRHRKAQARLQLELQAHLDKHPALGRMLNPNAVNTIQFPGGGTTPNTYIDPSGSIWGNCPEASIRESGKFVDDDFTMVGNATMSSAYAGSIGRWSTYGYAGSTLSTEAYDGGVVGLQCDGDNEGLTLLSSVGGFHFVFTSTLNLDACPMWFEARVAKSTVTATKIEAFVGLMAPTLASGLPAAAQPITTTDDTLMTAGDLFGFHLTGVAAPTEVQTAFVLTSGTINNPTNQTTLMASTGNSVLTANAFVKLGFIYDPNGPRKRIVAATARQTAGQVKRALIRFFVNGVELPSFLTADDVVNATAGQAFPTKHMSPVLSVMNQAGSSPGKLLVDWIKCYQGKPNTQQS